MLKRIAVIGLGPMGKAITRLYLNNHYQVSVWNRTGSKADEMARVGAKKVLAIADLLKENHTIILSLTDYDVMYKLLNAETENLKGRTLINLSSDTPENARKAQGWATSHGANYITGAIMVTPETLGKPDALIFYSAEKTIFAIQKPVLNLMGTADFVGSDPGLAQLFSIGLLNILFTTTAAMLHSTALLQQAGIKPTDFQPYMNEFISGLPEMLDGMGKEVETGLYDGEMNNMNMMTAAMAHVARAIHDARLNPSLTDLMKNIMVKTVDKGYGRNGITSVIEVLRTPS